MIALQRIARYKGRLVSASHCRRTFSVATSTVLSSHLHFPTRESIFGIPDTPGSCKHARFDLFSLCQCRFQCVFCNAPSTDSAEALNLPPQSLQNGKNMVCQGTEGDLGTETMKPISPKSSLWGRSEGRESDAEHLVCPGCGVFMQDSNPKAPGFFIRPAEKKEEKNPIDVKEALLEGKCGESKDEETQRDVNPNVDEQSPKKAEKLVVCARCHSLRHYGQVKDESVENLLPDFDFDNTLGARLVKTTKSRSTVVMVVDSVDFDGSFPRRAAALVSRAMEEGETAWKEGKSGNVPRLVLVVTKIDLLPTPVTPVRLENWVRQRARFGGALKLHGVHLVSAHKDWGIRNFAEHVKELAGPRGNVWVIGAQNAGKSTLINAIGKHVGGKVTQLTEAPVPGTTLGIIRIEGILPAKARLYDTPGLLHPHQISTRLNREEQKMVQIRKELKPRTYRLKVGQVVHIGGLMRLDIQEALVETIYVTVWASPHIPLHMGKIENANGIWQNHFGLQLQPPIGEERVSGLGEWQRRELKVSGNSWDFSSVDVAAAGLGWFSLSLKGDATLAVWTYDGVDITVRSALILHRAHIFEKSGFTVSKIVSKADKSKNGLSEKKNKNSKGEKCSDLRTEMTSEEGVK